ncbi:antitoxin HicB [Microbacterium sp.]|uniref:antitoxin HicB n=1 Tax=Microbacterium sp. TaxID=51671 RepID=UPI003A91625D
MSVRTFEVTVERDGNWWVFEIPELGTGGQAKSLAEVDFEAQGVAAMWLNVSPDTVAVNVTVKGPEHALSEWAAAERDEQDARKAQARAAERRRSVVRELRAQLSAPDVGRVLGISKQRVYQIEKSASSPDKVA